MQQVISSNNGISTSVPEITLPRNFSVQLVREVAGVQGDVIAYFNRKIPGFSVLDCMSMRQKLYDYTIGILDLMDQVMPVLTATPLLQDPVQATQSGSGTTRLPATTPAATNPVASLSDHTYFRLMKRILDQLHTRRFDPDIIPLAVTEVLGISGQSASSRYQMVASATSSLQKYSQTLQQIALKAKNQLENRASCSLNSRIRLATLPVQSEAQLPAASSVDAASHSSVTQSVVSNNEISTFVPEITLPHKFSIQLMREVTDVPGDPTTYFRQQIPGLSVLDCIFMHQKLCDYASGILDLIDTVMPVLTATPSLQDPDQAVQSGSDTTRLSETTPATAGSVVSLSDEESLRLMGCILYHLHTSGPEPDIMSTAVSEVFETSDRPTSSHCQMVVSITAFLRTYSRALHPTALTAVERLGGSVVCGLNPEVRLETVPARPETPPSATPPSAASPVDTALCPSVTAGARTRINATSAVTVLSTSCTTQPLSASQECVTGSEPNPVMHESASSSAHTEIPVERTSPAQPLPVLFQAPHPQQMCDDGQERSLFDTGMKLVVRPSAVHNNGVFLHGRNCRAGELVADYEGRFVYKYSLQTRPGHNLTATSVSLNRDRIRFLRDSRFVAWTGIYFKTGNQFLEIGILGRKAISFVNHSDDNANARLLTRFDKSYTYKRKGSDLYASRTNLRSLLKFLQIQVVATKDINDNQEILCKYTSKQQENVDFTNYTVIPTEQEEKEFFEALQSSAANAPESDGDSSSDSSSSDSDIPLSHLKSFPLSERRKREPYQIVVLADTAYKNFNTDILQPLVRRFRDRSAACLRDILEAIENDEQGFDTIRNHRAVLFNVARYRIPFKSGRNQAYEYEKDQLLLAFTANTIDKRFSVSLDDWKRFLNGKKLPEHSRYMTKRLKLSPDTEARGK